MTTSLTSHEIPCSNPIDRSLHTSTLFKNYLITYGGYSNRSQKSLSDFQILNLKTNSFEEFKLEGDEPYPRERHSACLIDSNKIIIFGGFDNGRILHDTAIITVQEIIPMSLTYKKMNTTGGTRVRRFYHSANVYQNKLYIFGGRHLCQPVQSNNELWCLDLESFGWKLCETIGNKPDDRATHSSLVYNGKLYIFGGYCDSKEMWTNDCWVLSLDIMRWQNLRIRGMSSLSMSLASTVLVGNLVFLIGGFYGTENRQNKIFTFNFDKKTLDSFECKGDYTPVRGGTAISYKNNLILWGGLKNDSESISQISCLQPSLASSKFLNSLENAYEGSDYSFSRYTGLLFGSEKYADVHFLIEGQQIPAHKLVLCLRCKYFSQLFTSKLDEQGTLKLIFRGGMKESHSSVIEITDVKLETFQALLKFLYQNEIELTENLAQDLYVLADKYMHTELLKLCESFLIKNVRLDNLVGLSELAEKFGVDSLKKAILEFIMQNIQVIRQNQSDYPISPAYIWEVAFQLQQKFQVCYLCETKYRL